MLIRIVRMTFEEDKLDQFLTIFQESQPRISQFPGCSHVELLRDVDQPNVRITYSLWESAEALAAYRQSDFFRKTWAVTKVLFADKPMAFSAEKESI